MIRTVTRSTMITQYLMFCEEEQVLPLSRATLLRISKIVDGLQQMGQEKCWAQEMKKSIQDGN